MAAPQTGYSGTPLAQKLGIKSGSRVLVDGDPAALDPDLLGDGVLDLGPLPGGVTLHRRPSRGDDYDVILLFVPDRARLAARWPSLHRRTTSAGALWVCWPKKAAKIPTDLGDDSVREYGLSNGRVDVKVAAVSQVWSGQKFVVRTVDR